MLLWTALIALALEIAFKVADYNFLSTDEATKPEKAVIIHTNSLDGNNTTFNTTNLFRNHNDDDNDQEEKRHNHSFKHQENTGLQETKHPHRSRRSISTRKINNRIVKPTVENWKAGIYRIQNKYAAVLLTIKVKQEICTVGCSDGVPPNWWETQETFETSDSIFQRSLSANFNLTKIIFKTQLWKINPIEKSKNFNLQPVASRNIFTDDTASQNLIDFKRSKTPNHKDWIVEEQDNFQSSFIPWNQSWIVKPIFTDGRNEKFQLKHKQLIKHWKVVTPLYYEIHTHMPDKCVNVNGDGYIGGCGEEASSWIFININHNADN